MDGVGFGTSASDFLWASGIEDTFVPQTRAGHRRLDEYELMDHYRLWRHDLDLAADLGIRALRYGIPWYRVNPRPGVFDWSWTDAVLEYLVEVKRLVPIIDLMHYGTPDWLDNHFINASYPRRVAEYAAAFAERYRGQVRYYTPLNEPGVTAAYCGRDGRWPPYLKGDDGYVKILLNLADGIARTADAVRTARSDAVLVHVEDVGLERPASPAQAAHAEAAQGRRLLPLDLVCGRIGPDHPAFAWLIEHGATAAGLRALADAMPRWDILGVNYYPWSNRSHVARRGGRVASRRDPDPAALADVLRLVAGRYDLPLMITETSSPGTHLERARWMTETLAAVRAARAEAVPVVGYTWFPMFTMIEWRYRWSRKRLTDHLLHLGLWDVHPRANRLDRDPTPLVETYRRFAADSAAAIGDWPTELIPAARVA